MAEAGPSGSKKVRYNNKRKLTEEEMWALLEESDDDLELSDKDSDYVYEEDSSSIESGEDDIALVQDVMNDAGDDTIADVRSNEMVTSNWEDNPTVMYNFPFIKQQQLLVPLPRDQPLDYFRMLVTDEFLKQVCEETNEYAISIFLQRGWQGESRINNWKHLAADELLTFIGLTFHMGHIKMPKIADYWKKKDPLFKMEAFSTHMSRNRFLLILRCLHFSKNPPDYEPAPSDRIYKIRPIINYFNKRMCDIYYPGRELSLDESMMLHRGRLNFRQYIKNKKHKYGIKLYMLTEANGVILKFMVYTGMADDCGGKGHTEKVVLHLLAEKEGVGHAVYIDNFYNSFELAKKLLDVKIHCTGTLRRDRKSNPKDVTNKKLIKGETIAKYKDGVLIGKWRDTRDVLYISTETTNNMQHTVSKRGIHKIKPEPINKYNQYMSGVDHQDQLLAYYPSQRKTVRWPTKIYIHILQMMMINAHILYKQHSGKIISFYEFRLSVIRDILSSEAPKEKSTANEHILTKRQEKSTKGRVMRKRCAKCAEKGQRVETVYECKLCPKAPGFCLDCCKIYHQ